MKKDAYKLFQDLDKNPTMAAYLQAARDLSAFTGSLKTIRVRLLSSFTIDQIKPFLEVEAARLGFATQVSIGPFNSAAPELLNPQSETFSIKPDVIVVAQELEDVAPAFLDQFLNLKEREKDAQMENICADIFRLIKGARGHYDGALFLHNFTTPLYPAAGLFDSINAGGLAAAIRQMNQKLLSMGREFPSVYVIDTDDLASRIGRKNWFDERMLYLARAPLSTDALLSLAQSYAATLQNVKGTPRKCLVLDLDNTLWGGVIGEDGLEGIKLGQTYPGNIYRRFQTAILQLHRRGVLLAVNSKNNPAEVDEAFNRHPDMVLKKNHFASIKANWNDKVSNMKEIATELNIGLDSFVFFDDSPLERALIQDSLPEVLTLAVPVEPERFIRTLVESHAFDKISITDEDRARGRMYQSEAARKEFQKTTLSLDDFYGSLDMSATIGVMDEFSFPRVLDLIHKTNQFNLTTRRHSQKDLRSLSKDPSNRVFTLSVADRFGDMGLVGTAIVKTNGKKASLDTFLMSCRVIGRKIETAFLSHILEWTQRQKLEIIEAEFIPTSKNAPAKDFLKNHGFHSAAGKWSLKLDKIPFARPPFIKTQEKEASHPT